MTPDELLQRIRERVTHPSTVKELMRALRLQKSEAPGVRRALKTLVARGALIETRGRHFGVPELMDLAPGRITVNPNGFGFVRLDHPIDEVTGDVYVAGHNLQAAMHGDRVLVRVEHHGADGRAEGRIVRILERGATTTVGRFDREEHGLQYVTPFDRRLLIDVQIPAGDDIGAAPGQMVVFGITRWPVHGRGALGRIVGIIGDLDEPGVDTHIIIRKHHIPDVHSEAASPRPRASASRSTRATSTRTDFRTVGVTIDGETRGISTTQSRSSGWRTGTTGSKSTSRTWRTTSPKEPRSTRGLRARHVGLLPRASRSHVPGRAGHRLVLPPSAGGSPRAVVRDGNRPSGNVVDTTLTTASSTATRA